MICNRSAVCFAVARDTAAANRARGVGRGIASDPIAQECSACCFTGLLVGIGAPEVSAAAPNAVNHGASRPISHKGPARCRTRRGCMIGNGSAVCFAVAPDAAGANRAVGVGRGIASDPIAQECSACCFTGLLVGIGAPEESAAAPNAVNRGASRPISREGPARCRTRRCCMSCNRSAVCLAVAPDAAGANRANHV
jgi:hypothetical protein